MAVWINFWHFFFKKKNWHKYLYIHESIQNKFIEEPHYEYEHKDEFTHIHVSIDSKTHIRNEENSLKNQRFPKSPAHIQT